MIRSGNARDAETIASIKIDTWRKTYLNIFPDELLENLEIDNEIEKCLKNLAKGIIMFEKYRLRRGLNKKQSLTKGDFVSEVIYANFGDEEHNMVVEDEKVFDEVYKKTCEDFAELEKADLLDFWRKEKSGRTDKKRRNLLRRP